MNRFFISISLIASLLFINPTTIREYQQQYPEELQQYIEMNSDYYIEQFNQNGQIIFEDNHIGQDGLKCEAELVLINGNAIMYLPNNNWEESINHEFGHYIDFTNGYYSNTDEWIDIWLEEKDYFDDYYSSSNRECFAAAYKEYIENNNEFKNNCTKMYDFLDKNIRK